jgi:cell division protease FtsH
MDNKNQNNKMPKNAQAIVIWVTAFLIAVAGISYLHNAITTRTNKELSYDTFMNMVD